MAIVDVGNQDLLKRIQRHRLQKFGIDAQAAVIVNVGTGDTGPVQLRLENLDVHYPLLQENVETSKNQYIEAPAAGGTPQRRRHSPSSIIVGTWRGNVKFQPQHVEAPIHRSRWRPLPASGRLDVQMFRRFDVFTFRRLPAVPMKTTSATRTIPPPKSVVGGTVSPNPR